MYAPATGPDPASVIAALLRSGTPDWAALDQPLPCPRCGYSLLHLPHPRCPECGLEFDWRELLTAVYSTDLRLFEHAWRRRPLRALLRQALLAARPNAWWSSVALASRVHPLPLLFVLALASGVTYIAGGVSDLVVYLIEIIRGNSTPIPVAPAYMVWFAVRTALGGEFLIALPVIAAFWLLTFGMFAILRETLARCRIRTVQLVRVTALAALAVSAWIAGLALACTVVNIADRYVSIAALNLRAVVLILLPVLAMHHLRIALRRYLRLPHATAVAIVSVATATLAVITAVIVIAIWGR